MCTLSRVCLGTKQEAKREETIERGTVVFHFVRDKDSWQTMAETPLYFHASCLITSLAPPSPSIFSRRRTISLRLIGGNYHEAAEKKEAAGVRAKAGANEEVDEGTSSNERFANDKCPLLEARGRVGS